MIYLFFTGLCYYVGTRARTFDVSNPEITIYFGGRGSAFLTWLDNQGKELQKVLNAAFQAGIAAAPIDEQTPRFRLNDKRPVTFAGLPFSNDDNYPAMKTEVARGLLDANFTDLAVDQADSNDGKTAAGELFWKKRDGTAIPFGALLKPSDLAEIKPPSESEFEGTTIGHFVAEMLKRQADENRGFVNGYGLDGEILRSLFPRGTAISESIKLSAESKDATDIVGQPIFAYELDDLMQQYAEKAAAAFRTSGTAR